MMSYSEISGDELEEIISGGENEYTILDVRTKKEYDDGHIPNAVQIDFYSPQFKDEIAKLQKDKTYYVVCRSGSRSGKTCGMMVELGFKRVFNLEGGMLRWTGDVE